MTKEDYIRMNRGINDSKDLPREYLEAIFDEIASNEIKMTGTLSHTGTLGRYSMAGVSDKQRRQAYTQEMAQKSEAAKTLMEGISDKSSSFTSATHIEHVRGMFKVRGVNLVSSSPGFCVTALAAYFKSEAVI